MAAEKEVRNPAPPICSIESFVKLLYTATDQKWLVAFFVGAWELARSGDYKGRQGKRIKMALQ